MTRFVIYQGSGGLIHMLGGLVYCIEWCRAHNCHLIIDVKNHAFFKHKISDFFDIAYFTNYSEDYDAIPPTITNFCRVPLTHIANHNASLMINNSYSMRNIDVGRSLDCYGNSNIRMYVGHGGNSRMNILKYMRVKQDVFDLMKEKINSIDSTILDSKYIGVHFRNTDRPNDINHYIASINRYHDATIYLATDDYTAYDKIKATMNPTNRLVQITNPFNGGGKPIHIVSTDKYELNMNILIDIYMLSKAVDFIPSEASLVSRFILLMRSINRTIFPVL
jgi:hypothetical protein